MKLVGFIIFVAVFYEIHGLSRVCGRSLTELLSVVCHGEFNPLIGKRSNKKQLNPDGVDALTVFNEIDDDDSPFKSESLLNDILFGDHVNTVTKTRRYRYVPGVHDECCVKPCTMEELSSYCKNPIE